MPRRKLHRLPRNPSDNVLGNLQSQLQTSTTTDYHRSEEIVVNDNLADLNHLRQELYIFFLSPIERWKISGEVPFALLVQILKLVIVTSQLILFGSMCAARVSYGERVAMSFKHSYLLDWDPQYETLPYPPSTGVYAVYSREKFYEAVGFAIRQFNRTESSSLNGYTFASANRTVTVCAQHYSPLSVNSKASYGDSSFVAACKDLNLLDIPENELATAESVERYMASQGLKLNFSTFRKLELGFVLSSPPIHHMDWDRSVECFQFDIKITFDDSGQTGQVVILLQSDVLEVSCFNSAAPTAPTEIDSNPSLRRIVHLIINLCAFNFSLLSQGICVMSLVKTFALMNKTRRFGIRRGDVIWEFLDPWTFVIMLSDLLITTGSTFKLLHNKYILEAYSEWSYLLGTGTLLVWISFLRYAKFSSKTDILLNTLRRSIPGLLRFLVCALILFFAFALSAWVIIGPFHMKFRTFASTLECLFSLINGDDMYVTFSIVGYDKGPGIFLISRIFLYIFITLFIYVVLNIFVTIIFEAYEEVKDSHEQMNGGRSGSSPLRPLLVTPTGNGPILAEPRLSFATINHATPNSVGGSSVDFFNLEGNERTPHEDYSSSISVVVGGENAQQESDGAEQRLLGN